MGKWNSNRREIVLAYVRNNKVLYVKDIIYLCKLMGISSKNAFTRNQLVGFNMTKVWNSSNAADSIMHTFEGKQGYYWWLSDEFKDTTWALREYHPQNRLDVKSIIANLERRDYVQSHTWPPAGKEYYKQEASDKEHYYIFWPETTGRDNPDDLWEAERKEDLADYFMARKKKNPGAPSKQKLHSCPTDAEAAARVTSEGC